MRFIILLLSYIIFSQVSLGQNLGKQLDSIYVEDQKYRLLLRVIETKYGVNSIEIKDQWKIITEKDSINLLKIKTILDQNGWPSSGVIGKKGSTTIFLVIQHADLLTQEKYLPMMSEAVNRGNASAAQLALLEDRVAIRQGKKQIYGSQIGRDPNTNQYYVLPLDDPDNVNKRRKKVGLEHFEKYLKNWDLKWDVEQYKKDLPSIEEKAKRN